MMKPRDRETPWVVAVLAMAVASCGPGDGTARAAEGRTETASTRLQELPEGVTREMVESGRELFQGAGFCYTCHGQEGRGVPQLGADLGDEEWLHADGSYEEIVQWIRSGVTAEASSVGVPMPPLGGGRLSDAQVRAVAAYVWVLSRSGT